MQFSNLAIRFHKKKKFLVVERLLIPIMMSFREQITIIAIFGLKHFIRTHLMFDPFSLEKQKGEV